MMLKLTEHVGITIFIQGLLTKMHIAAKAKAELHTFNNIKKHSETCKWNIH